MMNETTPAAVRLEPTKTGMFGSIDVPVDHKMTVESCVGRPPVFRYLFGFTVVAVTGGPSLNDVEAAVRDTYAKYVNHDAQWVASGASDSEDGDSDEDGTTRRLTREFTWTENNYLPMVSVVSCTSDEKSSMILHGSCAASAGEAELVTLRRVVASAQLP